MSADQIARATRWLANGYPPVPIMRHDAPLTVERKGKPVKQSPGKQPHWLLWNRKETAIYGATAAKLTGWKRLPDIADYPGLGIACGTVVGADVDVYEPELADEVVRLAVERLGPSCLRRAGQAPKTLLVYRAAGEPIAKKMTEVFFKGELKAQLEVLGQGQQFVGSGTHPATGQAYTWGKWSPDDVPLADLPAVTQQHVADLIVAAEALFRAAGYQTKAEIEAANAPPAEPRANLKGSGGEAKVNPFRTVNDAALAAPERWVPILFGNAAREDGRGAWRVSSAGLGRDREEDIGIAPKGIVDFGEHDMGDPKRGRRTAIDLVMEHGGAADATAAARWLADLLGIEIEISTKAKRKTPEIEIEAEAERWNERLHRNERGEARDIIHNVALILRIDDRFKGRLRWNQMLEAVEARHLPWRTGGWAAWTDADDIFLADWCQKRHAYVKRPTCAAAVQIVARDQQHHPIRERLNALTWDGTARFDSWLTTYLGAADTAFARAVGKAWLISAVARVFQPGCKADHCLILEGPQGAGKSTAAATIALDDGWFADELADLGTKDSAQDLRGKWIIELGELSALRRGEVERVKAFMSRRVDHYRPSHGTRSQDFPRQCVFIGSTNADSYLADETGGRRFWPVKVGAIDIARLKADREQLWAEAVAAYRAGAQWWLERETEQQARGEQTERRIVDPWEHRIIDYAAGRPEVTVAELLDTAIAMLPDRQGQADQNRVARILRANKWERVRARRNGSLTWIYRRSVEPDGSPTGNKGPGVGTSGNGKASVSAPVPTVPTVPSRVSVHAKTEQLRQTQREAQRDSCAVQGLGNGVGTGNTGNTPPPHPWRDIDHWQFQIGRAEGKPNQLRGVAREWAIAAGAQFDGYGMAVLPPLPDVLASRRLRLLLLNAGLIPRGPFAGIDVNASGAQQGAHP